MLSAPLVHGAYRGGPSLLPGFSLVCDFKRGLYRRGPGRGRMATSFLALPGAVCSRAGADLIVPGASGLRRFSANQPPIVSGRGLFGPEPTTNLCANHNVNPTDLTGLSAPGNGAILSVVDDQAELAAAGLSQVCTNGKVFKLDTTTASGVTTTTITSPAAVLAPHACSAYLRQVGEGIVQFALVGQQTENVALGPTYTRPVTVMTPGIVGRQFGIRVPTPGPIVYFILNQFEQKGYATAPVVVQGAQASRGAQVVALADLAGVFGSQYTIVARGRLPVAQAAAGSDVAFWLSEADSSAQYNLRRSSGAGSVALGISSATNINVTDPGVAPWALALSVDEATGQSRLCFNGVSTTQARAWPNVATAYFGGNSSGSTPLRDFLEFFGVIAGAQSDAVVDSFGRVG
jgi:hypothetical protein